LCYVGMTRAQQELFLIWARTRHLFGRVTACRPSRFLAETDAQYLHFINGSPFQLRMWAVTDQPQPRASGPKTQFRVGMTVAHAKWGRGTVVETETLGDQPVVVVEFAGGDRRRLMADFAPLTVVEE